MRRDVISFGNLKTRQAALFDFFVACLRYTEDSQTEESCSRQDVKEQRQTRVLVAFLWQIYSIQTRKKMLNVFQTRPNVSLNFDCVISIFIQIWSKSTLETLEERCHSLTAGWGWVWTCVHIYMAEECWTSLHNLFCSMSTHHFRAQRRRKAERHRNAGISWISILTWQIRNREKRT